MLKSLHVMIVSFIFPAPKEMVLEDVDSDWDEETQYHDAETQTSECEAQVQLTKPAIRIEVTPLSSRYCTVSIFLIKSYHYLNPTVLLKVRQWNRLLSEVTSH